ncbi:MAG: hypothetical protein A3C11_00140 [Candidatus Sungbacteria bacterium RIFCSPHIGHO2_02_FULL_49_12]|uniref:Uncharacterized protein n=1 Tax=Candidatus Sungbacteria bacterium RIFCSPHIGHO2_02_FULL_49_12 TaxID=1802271 RepID=A0A1G2KQV8_9BACT|nr:MAG: hypothetical protein A3C11_00140 [Candidatus Sungbacteria bacterium RIFCSPHIGHO2_02_FULL_49_12]
MDQQPGNDKENLNFRAGDDSGVKYTDETGWRAMRYYHEPMSPRIIQWTMKYSGGLITNERQANYVLIGFAVLAIIVSLYLFFGGSSSVKTPPKYLEDIAPEVRAKIPPEILKTLPSKIKSQQ